MNLFCVRFRFAEREKHAIRRMLQGCFERLRRAIERPADETHAKLAAFYELVFLFQIRLAAACASVSASQDSAAAGLRHRRDQADARDQRHWRAQDRMSNAKLLGQPRFHNSCPLPKFWYRLVAQTGMGLGPP